MPCAGDLGEVRPRDRSGHRAHLRRGRDAVLAPHDQQRRHVDPTEQRRRVFQPSLKSDRGLTRLWRLAYDAGGCVDLESTPGEGSVFRVTLPAAPQS